MERTIVGVVRGGTSSEYDLSLKTGAAIMSALPSGQYRTRDILIDKRGVWHVRGIPVAPMRALSQVDVAINGLHGGVGEDGSVTRVFEQSGIPYVGSGPLSSGMALNKVRARQMFSQAGLLIPKGVAFKLESGLSTGEMAAVVFRRFPAPYVVKPVSDGSSHGIRIVQNIIDLPEAVGDVLDTFGAALVEEYIRGYNATVGIVENFRNQTMYALPPAHTILPLDARSIESVHLRESLLNHKVPSNFSDLQKKRLMEFAIRAHQALGLSHFSQSDFVVTPREVYLLEVNANPGLYPGASFPTMLESVGSSVSELLLHTIELARAR